VAYSRWGGSCWYTFWSTSRAGCKAEERFSVNCAAEFTYAELVDSMDACIEKLKTINNEEEAFPAIHEGVTEQEIEELKEYMRMFIEDVDEHYGEDAN